MRTISLSPLLVVLWGCQELPVNEDALWTEDDTVEGSDSNKYYGEYPINRCSGDLESSGYAVGDTTYDFEMVDQHGDMVTLSDFCNSAVLLEASAFW